MSEQTSIKEVDELTVMRSLQQKLFLLPVESRYRVLNWLTGKVEEANRAEIQKKYDQAPKIARSNPFQSNEGIASSADLRLPVGH